MNIYSSRNSTSKVTGEKVFKHRKTGFPVLGISDATRHESHSRSKKVRRNLCQCFTLFAGSLSLTVLSSYVLGSLHVLNQSHNTTV